jgi:hypothetical protein
VQQPGNSPCSLTEFAVLLRGSAQALVKLFMLDLERVGDFKFHAIFLLVTSSL